MCCIATKSSSRPRMEILLVVRMSHIITLLTIERVDGSVDGADWLTYCPSLVCGQRIRYQSLPENEDVDR